MGIIGEQAVLYFKQLWEASEFRIVILFSLFLQLFLIFFAPLRKRTAKAYIILPLWAAYLLADTAVSFALKRMNRSHGDKRLLAFWAPFLLVHIGGPDTITAFALADNELWRRSLLGLALSVAFISFQSFPQNDLLLPTGLVFIAGLIKYSERALSLYLASWSGFRKSLFTMPDPGPDYAKLMDAYSSMKDAGLPARIEKNPGLDNRVIKIENGGDDIDPLTDFQVVRHAYNFFETFRGLIADLKIGFRELCQSREFFLNTATTRDAFKVVEVELNFLYEIFYTKAVLVHGKFGSFLRLLSLCLNCSALLLFHRIDKQRFHKADKRITYTLLFGAIASNAIAVLMGLFSDWSALVLNKSISILPVNVTQILRKLVDVVWKSRPEFLRRRWSESLSQYNLIRYCVHPRSKWREEVIGCFGLTKMLDGWKYVDTVDFTDDLRDFIFKELRMKALMADDLEAVKAIYSARGDWILWFEGRKKLLPWINEVDFDESLLLWHIATELCFDTTEREVRSDAANTTEGGTGNADYRDFSKLLSDYMLYLLVMQSTMMSPVASIGEIRFRDTCADAKRFFLKRQIQEQKKSCLGYIFAVGKKCCQNIFCFCCCCFKKCRDKEKTGPVQPDELQIRACESILVAFNATSAAVRNAASVRQGRSKSVLFKACILAEELKKLGEERKWEIMSRVWVEMLAYAACRCTPTDHVAQLSKGGQLLTFVWLLMAHFGLGNHFETNEWHSGAKLIVEE